MRFFGPVCPSFKSDNHVKTFVLNQHQNDPKNFLAYQIHDFSVYARELASGYKRVFSLH